MAGRATGAARWFTEQFTGSVTRENETNPTATTTSSVLVKAHPDRIGLLFVNLGSSNVFVGLTGAVSTTNGIRLSGNGGFFSMVMKDDFTLQAREWNGITDALTSAVYILEILADLALPPEQNPDNLQVLQPVVSAPYNRRY